MDSLVQEALGAVALAAVVAAPFAVWLIVRNRQAGRGWGTILRLGTVRTAAVVAALAVLVITVVLPALSGFDDQPPRTNWIPGETIGLFARSNANEDVVLGNLLGNVAMFVPVGAAVAAAARQAGRSAVWGAAGGLGLSALVEGLQYALPIGRSTDVDDLILNTLGATIGAVAATALRLGRRQDGLTKR